jgi:beta-lactamase regulating signal transducer with metallopeptidase domain/predicted  nucleic acid-binding Zn-ribbon protein
MDAALPLAYASVKALLLLAAAGGAALVLRKRPARLRAVVWATALAGCLLIPVLAPLVPAWSIPVPEPLAKLTASAEPRPAVEIRNPVAVDARHTTSTRRMPLVENRNTTPPPSHVNWRLWLLSLWATGATLLLARLGAGLLRVGRLIRRARPITDPQWLRMAAQAHSAVGCRRWIRLLTSPEIEIPATVGFLRPTVVLPLRAATWLDDRRRAVLLHELIHVARFDWPQRLVARMARAVYWFNPLAWWAARRLDLEQELACDEEVLALGTGASDYACHLLGIARHALPSPQAAIPALGMARRTHLEERIMTILQRSAHRRVRVAILVPLALLITAMVPALASVVPGEIMYETEARPESAAAPESPAIPAPPDTSSKPAPPTPPQAVPAPAPRPADPEIEEILAGMKAAEARIAPHVARIEAFEIEMEPALKALSEMEIGLEAGKLAEIEKRMQPYLERLEAIEVDMRPFEAQMEALEKELQSLELHVEDGTLDEVQRQIHHQMQAHMAKIEAIQIDMKPYLQQIEAIHDEMGQLHGQIARIHVDMEPVRAEMERAHREIERSARDIERLHRDMQPLEREMERLGERLEKAIQGEVEAYLRSELGAVTSPGAPFDEAAARIAEESHINVHDDVIRIDGSENETREILTDLFEPYRIGTEKGFQAAIEAAAAGLSPLVINAQ